jgi:hypothetical protein
MADQSEFGPDAMQPADEQNRTQIIREAPGTW